MASISFVEGKWRALIRRKGYKSISKRFATKAKALAWARDIEGQMLAGAVPQVVASRETVAQLIERYRRLRAATRPIMDTTTEHYTLKQLSRNLGHLVAATLAVDDLLIAHPPSCREIWSSHQPSPHSARPQRLAAVAGQQP